MGRSGSRRSKIRLATTNAPKKLLGAFASIKADPRHVGES
jgi:hypothetical protein